MSSALSSASHVDLAPAGASPLAPPRVSNLSHVELFTPKPDESLAFFRDVMGLEVSAQEGQSVYLRAFGEYPHHSLVLTERDRPGLGHVAMRVESPEQVDGFATGLAAAGIDVRRLDGGTEPGQGDAIRFTSPAGHDYELFYDFARAKPVRPSKLRNQPDAYPARGIEARRLDHVNLLAADVTANREFLERHLDFKLRESLQLDDGTEVGAWMSVTANVHDVAVMRDQAGTGQFNRLHHVAFWLDTREAMLRAADILAEHEVPIEAGPAKHGITQAFFLYLFEPGGNRVELFSGGFLIFDPDWEPIRWSEAEIERSIIWWGSPLPEAYFAYGT